MREDCDTAVLHDFIDHALVILQGVILRILLNDIFLEGHAAADAQDVVAVGILTAFDQDAPAVIRIGTFDGPVHLLFPGSGVIGDRQEAVLHPGR